MLQNPWIGVSFLFSIAEIYEWRLRAASDATTFGEERARGLSRDQRNYLRVAGIAARFCGAHKCQITPIRRRIRVN
jgi:hypothetical protein